MPPPTTANCKPVEPRALRWLLFGCAAAATALFVVGAWLRIPYPHELEWMEGGMVDEAARVANGQPLYCAPGPEYVPFVYAPLLHWLGGLAMVLGVPGLLAMRAIAAAATIGTGLLIGRWVWRETGTTAQAVCAFGLFLAGHGWLAWWFDLARNDSLFVLLCVATGFALRHGGPRRWLWAALLATLAPLAKQPALIWLLLTMVGAACHDWRNAWRCGIATTIGVVTSFGWLHLASDGWSTFYLFELPASHAVSDYHWLGFWTDDMPTILPLLLLGLIGLAARWRAGNRREALAMLAFAGGGLLTSWRSRLHVGGFDNVLMGALAAACVFGPSAPTASRRLRIVSCVLMLAQFACLGRAAWEQGQREHPNHLLPTAAHRQAHEELFAFVQAQPGPVWILAHGGISQRAGKGTGAHAQAILDLLQVMPKTADGWLELEAFVDRRRLAHLSPRTQEALGCLLDRTTEALWERRFAAVVHDEVGALQWPMLFFTGLLGPDRVPGTADDPYERLDRALLSDPAALRPPIGYAIHSPYAIVPRRAR